MFVGWLAYRKHTHTHTHTHTKKRKIKINKNKIIIITSVRPRIHHEGTEEPGGVAPPALHRPRVAKFFAVTPSIYGSSEANLVHIIQLKPKILRLRLLFILKIYAC